MTRAFVLSLLTCVRYIKEEKWTSEYLIYDDMCP